ncbi:MAG: sirohydrochlorin chelatase [Magnetococcales bacterium]|nr:sirohydrochlorin chelatase [Magnetococcales bacterium]
MGDTILLIGHGSREEEGNQEIEDFADYWRNKRPDDRIEVCFIEFADVLLDEGLDRAAKNSTRVIALPLIINAAGHVKMEIPEHIKKARINHPQVEFIYARHIGCDDHILKLLRMRLHSAMVSLAMPDPKNTGVILLGRGSSDRSANSEVAKMSRWVYETTRHDIVEYAFTGVTYPRLETMVQRMAKLGMMQVVVLPYYLFTGKLIKRITKQVERLQGQYPQVAIAQAGYLGINDRIVEIMDQRLAEAQGEQPTHMMECDGCKFREIAEAHVDHHHHDG